MPGQYRTEHLQIFHNINVPHSRVLVLHQDGAHGNHGLVIGFDVFKNTVTDQHGATVFAQAITIKVIPRITFVNPKCAHARVVFVFGVGVFVLIEQTVYAFIIPLIILAKPHLIQFIGVIPFIDQLRVSFAHAMAHKIRLIQI